MSIKIKKIMVFVILVFAVGLNLNTKNLLASITRINLTVGESSLLNIKDQIRVSKKGIIDIQEESDHYLITGLKEGTVMISPESSHEEKYLISVEKKRHTKNNSSSLNYKKRLANEDPDLKKMCEYYKVDCDHRSNEIRGFSKDLLAWKNLRAACLKKGCIFNLKLQDSIFEDLCKDLQKKLPYNFILKDKDQNIFIETECKDKSSSSGINTEFLNYLTGGFIKSQHIPVVCQSEPQVYLVKAYLVAFQKDSLYDYDLSLESLASKDFRRFSQIVKSAAIHKHASVIAEPSVYLSPNNKTSIHSGGEFRFVTSVEGTLVETWKKTGVQMDFNLDPRSADLISLDVNMDLVTADSSKEDQGKLNSNSISSKLSVPLGISTLVGTSDVVLQSSMLKTSSFIDKLPLISSLFSSREKTQIKSKLFLWIKIEDKTSLKEEGMIVDVIN